MFPSDCLVLLPKWAVGLGNRSGFRFGVNGRILSHRPASPPSSSANFAVGKRALESGLLHICQDSFFMQMVFDADQLAMPFAVEQSSESLCTFSNTPCLNTAPWNCSEKHLVSHSQLSSTDIEARQRLLMLSPGSDADTLRGLLLLLVVHCVTHVPFVRRYPLYYFLFQIYGKVDPTQTLCALSCAEMWSGHYLSFFGGGCRLSVTAKDSFLPSRKPTKRSSTTVPSAPVINRRTSLICLLAVSTPLTASRRSPTSTTPHCPTGPCGKKDTTWKARRMSMGESCSRLNREQS